MLISELLVKGLVDLELPERCLCGFSDLSVHGNWTNGRIKIEARCMRCGKPVIVVNIDD